MIAMFHMHNHPFALQFSNYAKHEMEHRTLSLQKTKIEDEETVALLEKQKIKKRMLIIKR